MPDAEEVSTFASIDVAHYGPGMSLSGFIEQIKELDEFLQTYIAGVQFEAEAVARHHVSQHHCRECEQGNTHRAKMIRERAQRVQASGYWFSNTLATVRLWSIFTAATEHALDMTIRSHPDQLKVAKDAKVSVAEIVALPADEQRRLLAREIMDTLRDGRRKTQDAMRAMGLKADYRKNHEHALTELWAMRNAIVHNGGCADRRTLEVCGWLPIRVGDRLPLQFDCFDIHASACELAIQNANLQLDKRDGKAVPAAREAGLDTLAARLDGLWIKRSERFDALRADRQRLCAAKPSPPPGRAANESA